MKKCWNTLGVFVMAMLLANSFTTNAHAAEKIPYDKLSVFSYKQREGYYFDAARYAADYPDLYASFGNDKDALWNHYKTKGIAEKRIVYGTTDEANAKLLAYDVADEIIGEGMSDREKINAVHDWIVNNTAYDYQNYLNDTIPDISYDMEGVMLKKTAVCAGYAEAFSFFMHILGIRDEYISGIATNSTGIPGRHAWNRVFIDGDWLYVDCTWDDPISDSGNILQHDYLLISYDEISKDHTLERTYTLY